MRRLTQHRRFGSDLKRLKRRGKELGDLFAVVDLLIEFGTLPPNFRPHPLVGEWKGVLECHIDADWLLLYEVGEEEVILLRTGTHRDLFE